MAALASFMEMGAPCWEGGCHTDSRMVPLPTHQCTLCTSRPHTPIILASRSKAFVILFERGVRVVQIMHRGWDSHSDLPVQLGGARGAAGVARHHILQGRQAVDEVHVLG